MNPNPVLKKLGFADDERVAIIHVDDVGMCQASIDAFAELDAFGLVSCGAVMMPCPWSLEAAKYARQHSDADLGVHLTLTSEWETYRWGPISTRDPQSGLIDAEGCFYHLAHQVQEHADPEAAGREIVAQIEAAKAAGIDPTHADTHMGTLAHPKFMQSYVQLAIQQQVPPMMLRLDEEGWRRVTGEHEGAVLDEATIGVAVEMVNTLEEMGVPLLDAIGGLPLDTHPALRLEHAKRAFDVLKPGVTHFIIHAAKDTPELRAITPNDWACRAADYETFLKEELRQYVRDIGVQVIGYRPLKELMTTVSL